MGTKETNGQKPRLMSGAEIFIRSLEAEGVDVLFGYPGAATIAIYDVLYGIAAGKNVVIEKEEAESTDETDSNSRSSKFVIMEQYKEQHNDHDKSTRQTDAQTNFRR